MSETETAGAADTVTTFVKSIKMSSLGVPRAPNVPAGEHEVILGGILGEITGCREYVTEDRNGQELVAYPLTGMFRGMSADGKIVINSSTLYLPAGFHDTVADSLLMPELDKDGKPTGKKVHNGGRIKIAYVVKTIPSTSKAGYAYKIDVIESAEEAAGNPIDAMARKHSGALAKLLPGAQALLPAPEAPASKGKK